MGLLIVTCWGFGFRALCFGFGGGFRLLSGYLLWVGVVFDYGWMPYSLRCFSGWFLGSWGIRVVVGFLGYFRVIAILGL